MNKINPSDKAFPSDVFYQTGMDVRTYIATQLMAGSLPDPDGHYITTVREKAELAVIGADILINELNKSKPNG